MERNYECLLILDPTLSEEAVTQEMNTLSGLFPEGAAVCQNLGRKKFAYPIKKQSQGYYVSCNFRTDPAGKSGLEQKIKLNPAVLRYLIVLALRAKKKEA